MIMVDTNGNGKAPPPSVGLITGSGTYALAALENPRRLVVESEHGTASVTTGRHGGVALAHISRHGNGHPRLSHQVNHRANIAALALLGVSCIVATTICGAVDPSLRIGELVVFDDLYFPSNRLPDGSLCTFHTRPGGSDRAHWIFERPCSEGVGGVLSAAAQGAGYPCRDGGCYGHVDGPRFNTATEIRALRAFGVSAVSQTAGPEIVLAGEVGIPISLLGYVTDHANGGGPQPTTVEELMINTRASRDVFAGVFRESLPRLAGKRFDAPGTSYGFERRADVYTSPEPNATAGVA
jgi:5'-methylthioadenosine phosphorylase